MAVGPITFPVKVSSLLENTLFLHLGSKTDAETPCMSFSLWFALTPVAGSEKGYDDSNNYDHNNDNNIYNDNK